MSRDSVGRLFAAAMFAAGAQSAFAQGIADPTLPPAGFSAGENAEEAVRGPVLQSIMIRPHSRSAIISGERVTLGGNYGNARVAAIRETEVVLRSNSGTETLRLYPDVQMKPSKSAGRPALKPRRERN
jgi:hypothetical protein